MKAISVYDLKLIPQLYHLTYFDMVDPKNDHLVNPWLYIMGFNIDKGLSYTVSQHRTLQNTVEVGFVIRGEVRTDREFLTSKWATVEDRLAAAAITDPSLCVEMGHMLNSTVRLGAFDSNAADGEPEADFPESLSNPDEADLVEQIAQLQGLLDSIRGDQFREDGSRKRPEDYQATAEVSQQRKKLRTAAT